MLYKLLPTRISDSKDLRCAKIETHPMKNHQNDEKSKFLQTHKMVQKTLQNQKTNAKNNF